MTMKLAEILPYASGFAVEPQELISIFEGYGGILPAANQAAAKKGIEIFQIESRNPHLHEERSRVHLTQMISPVLAVIYHSVLCNSEIKQQILKGLRDQGALQPEEEIPRPHLIAPLKKADVQSFASFMKEHLRTYSALEE